MELGLYPPTFLLEVVYHGGQRPSILLKFLRVLSDLMASGQGCYYFFFVGRDVRIEVRLSLNSSMSLSQLCIFSHRYHIENNLSAPCWPWEQLWVSIGFLASAQTMNRVPACNRVTDLKKGLRCSWDQGHQCGFWAQYKPWTSAQHLVRQ